MTAFKKSIVLLVAALGIVSCRSDEEPGLHRFELIGEWNWISSCGGYTGGCWYPDEDNYESLKFTYHLLIRKRNGMVDEVIKYSIVDSYVIGNHTIYRMKLADGRTVLYKFVSGHLSMENGDSWDDYERIQ